MSQRASVPKFGDWASQGGNEEFPYTVCFDNARKGRSSSGKIPNPNDPQQNPNSFPHVAPQRDEPRNLAPQVRTTAQQDRKTRADDRADSRTTTDGIRQSRPQSFGGELHTRSANKSTASSAADEGGASSNRTKKGSRLSRPQSYGGHTAATPNNAADHGKSSSRVAASPIFEVRGKRGGGNGNVLPKFGEWEGKNAAGGGEGYTQVFNKVREDKKISSGMTPLHLHPEQQSPNQTGHKKNSTGGRSESMGPCCFPWSRK